MIFHALVRLITSLLLGQLIGFLPPEPSDAIPGAWIWSENTARLWLLPIIVATGGLVSGLLACWARNSDGIEAKGLRGTDAAIRAWHEGVGILKRVPVVVMLASSALIGSGGSAGVEGPSAQIGLGIGSGIADLFHLNPDERRLVQAWGMGALVAAMFHSPLGGAIFAGEILRRRGANLKVIPGALISSIIASSLNGWGPTLIWPSHVSATWSHLFWTSAVLGLVCGVTGRLYAFALSWTKQTFKKAKVLEPLKPVLGGLLVGLLGLVYPQVLGLGNGWLQVTISLPMSFPLWIIIALPIAKLLATSLCVGSGGIGGIFGPGMIIGGLLGAAYWSVLHILPLPAGIIADTPAIFVMVGMIALLGPIARTPVAVTVMVVNLTGNVSFVPAAVCALIVSSWVVKGTTIYPSQP
ncbi:MAG: chloride channel protein [Ktedonobacteraceae bacterium]|nr:chloride channel protein [Ktedonobacteraceae bacterium]